MSKFDERGIIEKLKGRLNEKRLQHSINVMKMSGLLAERNGIDVAKARLTGILHDCAKCMSNEELINYCANNEIFIDDIKRNSPGTLHAEVGADIAKKEFMADEEICEAIKYHTLASKHMTTLDKIIYVADLIEEGRDLEGLEIIRETALKNLHRGYILSLEYCIDNVKERGKEIHPQSMEALEFAKDYSNGGGTNERLF